MNFYNLFLQTFVFLWKFNAMINFNASVRYSHGSGAPLMSSNRPRLQFNIITDEPRLPEQLGSLLHPLCTEATPGIQYYDNYDLLLDECLLAATRRIVFVQMEKPGFFNFLKQVDRTNTDVIAIINGSEEELLATRLLELKCMVKRQISPDSLQLLLEQITSESDPV